MADISYCFIITAYPGLNCNIIFILALT